MGMDWVISFNHGLRCAAHTTVSSTFLSQSFSHSNRGSVTGKGGSSMLQLQSDVFRIEGGFIWEVHSITMYHGALDRLDGFYLITFPLSWWACGGLLQNISCAILHTIYNHRRGCRNRGRRMGKGRYNPWWGSALFNFEGSTHYTLPTLHLCLFSRECFYDEFLRRLLLLPQLSNQQNIDQTRMI